MLGATLSSILAVLGPVAFLLISPAGLAILTERHSNHLIQESYSGLRSALRAVVQDSAAFREIWERATLGHRPLPAIDFTRDMVIVAAMGARSSTGHAIHIQSVRAEGPALQVRVLLAPAAPGCGRGMMETYPVDIVRAPRDDRRVVTFVEGIEAQRCGS